MNLQVNPNNPRTITKEQFERLKGKIQRNPDGLSANKIVHKNGVIIAGNQRWRALQKLGLKLKDEWFKDVSGWTDEQIKEYLIVSNVSDGTWDWDILANEWDTDLLKDWGVELPAGFGEEEVIEDEAPSVADVAISKLGEIYQLGRHRLMCGDSTDFGQVSDLMNGVEIDLLLTDPPYGDLKIFQDKNKKIVGKDSFKPLGVGKGSVRIKARTYEGEYHGEGQFDIKPMIKVIDDLGIKARVIWGYQYFADILPQTTSILCWDKTGGKDEVKTIFSHIELAWSKGLSNAQAAKVFHYLWLGFMREGERLTRVHPTEKPIPLSAWVLKDLAPTSKSILDLFGGSGSTLIACEQLDRICFMMELDPKYFDVIRKRYWKFTHDNNEEGWEDGTPVITEKAPSNGKRAKLTEALA